MPPSTAGFDDVYILSLPSFTWIKMYPPGNGTGEFPHHSLTCTVTTDLSQMFVIGGTFPLSDMCDTPEQWGMHNLDLGRQNPTGADWLLYDPKKKGYVVPKDISDEIGGGKEGAATKMTPEDGFDSPDLKILLSRTASSPKREPTRDIPDGDMGASLSRGEIAGIAVGSVAGVFLIALTAFCLFRRRRRRYTSTVNLGPDTDCSEARDHVLPLPTPQTDPIELAAEAPTTPGMYTQTPDSERGKDQWAVSPGGTASAVDDGAHELSATPGPGSGGGTYERVHTTYYHA